MSGASFIHPKPVYIATGGANTTIEHRTAFGFIWKIKHVSFLLQTKALCCLELALY
jgi:hypothetical protein